MAGSATIGTSVPERLILLLGHENTSTKLSIIASSRCDKAIALLNHTPNSVILPTGTFGKFNEGVKPHASYLTDYLKAKGVAAERILPGTDSTNTFEDCLCARKVARDTGVLEVLVVTSDYHAGRVKLILQNVLRDIAVSVHEAATPDKCKPEEERKERESLKRLKADWITPPLYEAGKFPNAVYEAAANDQRHYDGISLATVTAIVVVSAVPVFSVVSFLDGCWNAVPFFSVALVDLALWAIYERASCTARTARRTVRAIEIGFGVRGFSANYEPERLFLRWFPTIKSSVRFLIALMLVALVSAGVVPLYNCLGWPLVRSLVTG